jgi:hypothetical protein
MASTMLLSSMALKSINQSELTQLPTQTLEAILNKQPTHILFELKKTHTSYLAELCNSILNKRSRFFIYKQNSPGHNEVSFFTSDVSNVTIIEATSAEEANKKANSFGIKFNDDPELLEIKEEDPELYEEYIADDMNRWIKQTDEDGVLDPEQILLAQGGFFSYYIHYLDGTVERVGKCRPAGSHDYFEFWDSYNLDFTNFPKKSGLSLLSRQEFDNIKRNVAPHIIKPCLLWEPSTFGAPRPPPF